MSTEKSAVISNCGLYRYELRRVWEPDKGIVNFIGLNPSTADAETDDPTIRRCINFARDWGYGGLIITNLFATRLTDSKQLHLVNFPVGPDNDWWLRHAANEAKIVVAAWGAHPLAPKRGKRALNVILDDFACAPIHCLALTKDDQPRHPLYLRGDLKPVRYDP